MVLSVKATIKKWMDDSMALKRTLGLTMLTLYSTGMILGAGIYSIIGQAAGIAGYGLWQGFIFAAIAALLTALSYAELATIYPKAGGEYIYLRNAFPEYRWIAGTIGNIMIFAGSASAATVALAFASYLNHFIEFSSLLIAMSLLVVFTGVNILGIQQSSWVNAIFTVIEVFGLIIFIWLGWQSPNFGNDFQILPNMAVVSSAALIIFAYFGFENIVNLAEETKEPEKTIPRAILLSLTISTVLYILVSLAAVALMSPDKLALTESPLTEASKSSPKIAGILGAIALFSTANTALIALLTTSRILYGISRDSSLPKILSLTLSVQKTPWVAGLFALALAMALLPLGKVKTLASVASFTTMISFIAVNVTVIVLRIKAPDVSRPFKIPFSLKSIPLFPLLGILCCVVFLFQFNQEEHIVGILAFVFSCGFFFLNLKLNRGQPD
jgi:basic amino acid/polyamine antiporter, APA family